MRRGERKKALQAWSAQERETQAKSPRVIHHGRWYFVVRLSPAKQQALGAAYEVQLLDAVPLDFQRNSNELEELYTRFLSVLRRTTLLVLQQQTARAYGAPTGGPPIPAHFLGLHQAMHLAMHWGQIRTIRNLFQKTRGEPARFYPVNPTYPA